MVTPRNEISGGVEKRELFTQAIPAITRLNVSFIWATFGDVREKYTGKKEGNLKLRTNYMKNKINL